jgi:hypothetical protein
MVRGLYLPNDRTFWDLLKDTWYYAAIMILINVLSVYFASSAFIAPLERLAVRLKDKKTTAATVGHGSYLEYLWLHKQACNAGHCTVGS